MLLPQSVSKGIGLREALTALRLSARTTRWRSETPRTIHRKLRETTALAPHFRRSCEVAGAHARAFCWTAAENFRDQCEAEVLSGLAAGDQVIVFPSDRVRDGLRVRPRK